MTKQFCLDFHGTMFAVRKACLFDLFERHPEFVAESSYQIQSSVPLEIFEVFVKALESGGKFPVTKENADAISLLAKEFWLEDLLSECSALQVASVPELIAALSARISKLEHYMSSQPLALIAELKESIASQDRQLESLDSRVSGLEKNLRQPRTDLIELKSSSPASFSTPIPVPPLSPSQSLKGIHFPLKEARSFDGIIAYLTRKHGGNVHDNGIVTLTAKSISSPRFGMLALRNIADFTSTDCFLSDSKPDQWICWDFHQKRVWPTHYTTNCARLKSWVIEGSLDGRAWTEIDRKTDNSDLNSDPWRASFAVANSAECRFIRFTKTAMNHTGQFRLYCTGFEFFGTLLE
jgi:uncharacterized coiled-coil protein SlyX